MTEFKQDVSGIISEYHKLQQEAANTVSSYLDSIARKCENDWIYYWSPQELREMIAEQGGQVNPDILITPDGMPTQIYHELRDSWAEQFA